MYDKDTPLDIIDIKQRRAEILVNIPKLYELYDQIDRKETENILSKGDFIKKERKNVRRNSKIGFKILNSVFTSEIYRRLITTIILFPGMPVHYIYLICNPSTYSKDRFKKIVYDLQNLGLIRKEKMTKRDKEIYPRFKERIKYYPVISKIKTLEYFLMNFFN